MASLEIADIKKKIRTKTFEREIGVQKKKGNEESDRVVRAKYIFSQVRRVTINNRTQMTRKSCSCLSGYPTTDHATSVIN